MSDALESLNGLVVPLAEQSLLLPHVAVAELIGYRLTQSASQGPAWFLGWTLWREQQIPLIDPQELLGPSAEPSQTSRTLVLNAVSGHPGLEVIAMRVRGIPRSKKIARSEIEAAGSASEFIHQPVRLAGEANTLLIPDLAAIEQALVRSGVLRV